MSFRLKKYLFAPLVLIYFLTVAGMPVYLHYCGGEIEEVSYLLQSDDCCGEEEAPVDDCCHNEGYILQYAADFTLKDLSPDLVKAAVQHFSLPTGIAQPQHSPDVIAVVMGDQHVPWQHALLAEITVLRI